MTRSDDYGRARSHEDAPRGRRSVQPLYPRLRASKSVPREQVRADQARRLRGAMVEAVARHGYEDTTVDELVALAGVSTRALYELFGGKLGCFEATYEHIVRQQARRIAAACNDERGSLSWEERMRLAFNAFLEEVVEQPSCARLTLAEPLALGPSARPLLDRGEAAFERLLTEGPDQAPRDGALPPAVVRGVLHGLWSLARRALLAGHEQQLRGDGETLARWLLALRPAESDVPRLLELTSGAGGRPPARAQRGTVRQGTGAQHSGPEVERVRVLDACARLAASEGYAALTWTRLGRESGAGAERVHELFTSPEECFAAAVEMLSARALARALRRASDVMDWTQAPRDAADWGQAVCVALDSLYCDAARDPVFARLCFVEALLARTAPGARWTQRRAALLESFAAVLVARAPRGHAPDPLTAELIAGAVWGIAHREVLCGNAGSLPSLTAAAAYVTLAPVLGAGAALDALVGWAKTDAKARR